MNSTDRKTMKLRSELTLIAIEDSGTLLDVGKRCYYDLNDTAFFLVRHMEEGCCYRSLTAEFISEFNVGQETARSDIDYFIDELLRLGLAVLEKAKGEPLPMMSKGPGRKPYHAPLIEYQKELAVASGSEPLTPDA